MLFQGRIKLWTFTNPTLTLDGMIKYVEETLHMEETLISSNTSDLRYTTSSKSIYMLLVTIYNVI